METDQIEAALQKGELYPPGSDFLCNFDFTSLEELDPSLCGGWMVVYEREVPAEIRLQSSHRTTPHEVGTVEPLSVKILVKGPECRPTEVRVEIMSENDLFLHYTHKCNEHEFAALSEQQRLLVELVDYPGVIMKMANCAIREPHCFVTVVVLKSDGTASLSFVQNVEYKFVELLTIPFLQSSEDLIRNSIAYRYHVVKSKLALMHARLQDVGALLKSKNPQLLKQLEKCANVLSTTCPPLMPCTNLDV